MAISEIYGCIEHSCDCSTDLIEIWHNSFKNSLLYIVQGWCSSLSVPRARKYMEKCLILTGIYSLKATVSLIIGYILTDTGYISKIKGLDVGFMEGFLSSWMHLVCTFECKFPGVFSETINQIISNIHDKNPDEILAFVTGIHLTYIYESRYNLHVISDVVGSHDIWKTIYLLSNHRNERVCISCLDFVQEALPKKKFSIGMIYFVLQTSLKRIFELSENPDNSSILHDALQDGFISLILKLIKEYQAVDVMVDFVFDAFYSVFTRKDQINM